MSIDRDIELVIRRRCTTHAEAHTRRRRHAACNRARGHWLTVAGQRTCIQLKGGGAGELEHRPTLREETGIVGRIADRRLGDQGGGRVTRAAGADKTVGLGRQLEAVTGDRGIFAGPDIRVLKGHVQGEGHAPEGHIGTALGLGIEGAALTRLGRDVIASRVRDLELGAAHKRQAVRLATAKLRIELWTGTHQPR
ncbi:hypothetical protein D3C71_1624060 [compost metagenome]